MDEALPKGVTVVLVGKRRYFEFAKCDHCGKGPFRRQFSMDWNNLFRDFHYCGKRCSTIAVANRRKALGTPVSGAQFRNYKERMI
jgi:hypothetical protein